MSGAPLAAVPGFATRLGDLRVAGGLAALLAVGVIVAASWWSAVDGRYAGWFSDSVDYLAISDFYRTALGGDDDPARSTNYRTTRFPPLYPLILALAGGGSSHEREAFVASGVLWLAAMAIVGLWLTRRTGAWVAAAFLLLAVAVCPGVFMLRLGLFSESLFIALAYLALWMCDRRRPVTWSHALALALVAGVAPLARSIGIALVLAVSIHLLRLTELSRARRFAAVAICAAPFLAWTAHRALLPASASYTQSLTLDRVLAAFGGLEGWLLGQPVRLLDAALSLWAPTPDAPVRWLAGALLVLAALGLIRAAVRLAPDALFALFTAAILLIWPFPAELARMLAPLAPIIALHAVHGAGLLLPGSRRETSVTWPALGALAVVVGLGLVLAATPMAQRIVARLAQPVPPDLAAFRHLPTYFVPAGDAWAYKTLEVNARVVATAQEVRQVVPAGSTVCTIVPGFLALYGRIPATDLEHGLLTPEQAAPALRDCNYLFLLGATSPQHGDPPMYPVNVVPSERLRPVLLARYRFLGQEGVAAGLVELLPEASAPQTQGKPPRS